MGRNYFFYLITLFFIFSYTTSKSQVSDTLNSEEEIIDTVIVKMDPVIIKRTVFVKGEKKSRPIPNPDNLRGLDVFINSGTYNNYYSSCEICKPYFDKVKEAAHPILSYGAGLGY
jgi:hypothetical protein